MGADRRQGDTSLYRGGYGGTITGIGSYLKERNRGVRIIGCPPQRDHSIQGWRNFEESAKPDLFLRRENIVDDWVSVSDDEAFAVVRDILERDGMLVSPSSAAVYASIKKYLVEEGCLVGIFADDGRKFKSVYASRGVMNESEFEVALIHARHVSEPAY